MPLVGCRSDRSLLATAIASGILLGNLAGILPFAPQDSVKLGIDKLVPLAKMLSLASFVAHAELLAGLSRRRIVLEVRGMDAIQLQVLEAVSQHFSRRLGRVALSPVVDPEPVSDFSVLMLLLRPADRCRRSGAHRFAT